MVETSNQSEQNAPKEEAAASSAEAPRPVPALLQFVLDDHLPTGPLGPDEVPPEVLALPISLATERLVQHRKRCTKGRSCSYMPSSLRRYLRMRPRELKGASSEVGSVLWTEPEHGVVVTTRETLLEEHTDVADRIAQGCLRESDGFTGLLRDLGSDGLQILAGVLWASDFAGPDAELVFRTLTALKRKELVSEAPSDAGDDDESFLRRLKAQLKSARRETKKAKRTAQQSQATIRQKEQRLTELRQAKEEAEQQLRAAVAGREDADTELRELRQAQNSAEQDSERATRINQNLRTDLQSLREEHAELQVALSNLARKLGEEARSVGHLKLELASQPEGQDLAWKFLKDEEKRIQDDRLILQGGDRERAGREWTAYRKVEQAFLEAYPVYRTPPPVKLRPKTTLRFVALGGSSEVGKSCYLLELGQHRLLVDCGIQPSRSQSLHPAIDQLDHVNALVLTHAHTDHIGWVPALLRRFPEIDIYCSEGTAALLPVMLRDCHRHYRRELATLNDRARHVGNIEPAVEAYDRKNVDAASEVTVVCPFGKEEFLPFGDLSLQFYSAGHILGASSVLIRDQTGRSIFVSGDFSSFPQLTLQPAAWPEDLGEIDLLILESTYGDRTHTPLRESRNELVEFLRETLEERQGAVILASFALGRAQELLKLIASAQNDGRIPASVSVHIDGMIRSINPIYQELVNLNLPESFNEVTGETERREIATHDAHLKPSIIVTTSGMLAGGPVVEYARHLLPHDRHRIVLTGYQDEGAPSQALRRITQSGGGPRLVQVPDERGDLVQFKAALPAKEIGLSAHADQPGLLEYAKKIQPKHIVLVHGAPAAQAALSHRLQEVHNRATIWEGPDDELIIP